MADLKNELVWSHSRARTFAGCPRAYWFTYYGSWGGWDAEAPPATRDAYVQKKLTTRAMWTGTVVHGIAEEGIRRVMAGRTLDVDLAVRVATHRARGDLAGSLSGWWLGRPARRTGFREHYYGEPIDPAAWEGAIDEITRQVRNLHTNRIFRRIAQVPGRVLEVEELQRFRVGSTEVYVSLDVLMSDGQGGVVIIDWKTGDAHKEAVIAAQLGVYGIYATQQLGVPTDRVKAMHVNLRHGTETLHAVGPAEIDAARAEIEASVAEMRARLVNVEHNVADREEYPTLPEDDPRCRWCSFRRSCGRENSSGPDKICPPP